MVCLMRYKVLDVRAKDRSGTRGMAQPQPAEWRNLEWYIVVADIGQIHMDGEIHTGTNYHCPVYMQAQFEKKINSIIAAAKKFVSQDHRLPQWAGGQPNSLNY